MRKSGVFLAVILLAVAACQQPQRAATPEEREAARVGYRNALNPLCASFRQTCDPITEQAADCLLTQADDAQIIKIAAARNSAQEARSTIKGQTVLACVGGGMNLDGTAAQALMSAVSGGL